jgi:putative oxidoreductase
MKKIFAPGKDSILTSFGLLVLRLWIGLTMMLNHGLDKLTHFDVYSQHFISFMGLSSSVSLCLSIFAEFFSSALLVLGLFTRFGALALTINMSVAFFIVMKGSLNGNGELAFVYLMGYVVLLLTGPGSVSLDKMIFGKGKSGWSK